MKAYKFTLNTVLALISIWVLIAGNMTIGDLSVVSALLLVTAFFRIYYKESFEYFTRYEPSRYDESGGDPEPEKSKSESSKTKLI